METTTQPRSSQADLIEQVVAWHNRHPLTSRIKASQVCGIGVVALPFTQPVARGRSKPLFDEDFIAPLKAAAIATFVRRHGSTERPGQDDWPQRDIPSGKSANAATLAETRFVLTAAIESGRRRIRILIADGAKPRIIGPRFWSRRRLRGSTFASVGLVAIAAIGWMGWPVDGNDSVSHADQIDSGVVVQVAESQPTTSLSAAPAASAASAAPLIQASDDPQAPPAAVQTAHLTSPAIPAASAPAMAGAESSEETAPMGAAAAPMETPPVAVARQALHSSAKPKDVAARKQADTAKDTSTEKKEIFAVATETTASRAASQLRLTLLDAPTEPHPDRPHAELMRVGVRWRVVIWPLADKPAAESLRRGLADRGIKGEVIGF